MSNSSRAAKMAEHPEFQARVRALLLRKVSFAVADNAADKAQLVEAFRRVSASPDKARYSYISFAMVPLITAQANPEDGGASITDEDLQSVIDEYFVSFSELFA